MKKLIVTIFVFVFLTGCEKKPTIEGLWTVKSVKIGDQEMTPNARWMRFNNDFTQESGNGWFQHSIGTWNLTPENELTVVNTNGLEDLNEPFKVTINENTMTWNRKEEGASIEILLERSEQLPETYGDKLLGLWKLEEANGNGAYFNPTDSSNTKNYIFFRWDKRFVANSENGRISGVYNVHGHKPEVELIPYGDQWQRDFWNIDFDQDEIVLKLLNTDSIVTRKFKRIHNFPH